MIPFFISAIALTVLLYFYLTSSMEIANVWLNSHQQTPLLYKIAGLWGNHEGSMLLFYTFLTAWLGLLVRDSESIRLASFILLAIGSYLYFAANPFTLLTVKMAAGQDLNPALQNPYLAIHPPILYAGQTLCFVLWLMACTTPNHSRIPLYTRLCFALITLGLVLGARWAYGELGWGGFWFWDPVETVSLFPWLAIAGATHAIDNPRLNQLCLLLSFPMVMLGLTLVRSGVLVSVHSFGFDVYNGLWLGACTLIVCIISLLFVIASPHRVRGNPVHTLRTLIPIGFLSTLAVFCVLILIPVFCRILFNTNISIDEQFFHQYINPSLLLLLIFAGFAPIMKAHWQSLFSAILCAALWCMAIQPYFHLFAACAALVAFWVGLSTLNYLKDFFTKGFVAAHLGIGLCILGASHAEIFTQKKEFNVAQLPPKFASHSISYTSQHLIETPQVSREILNFSVDGHPLSPEFQHFYIAQMTKHQSAWTRTNLDHIHSVIFADGNTWKVELMLKPFISLFWLGLTFVLLGILISARMVFF